MTVNDLMPTEFLDYDSPEIQQFVRRVVDQDSPVRQQAIALYRAVRDDVLYEVYGANLSRAGVRASNVLRRGTGMCVHKSVLYAATLRAIGVPSRLVLTDVRNHLASQRLRDLVGGDVFRFHCLVSVWLDGQWVKATPVFNSRLCRLYGIAPLDFDGTADSLHHPFDLTGRRHMEFLHTHGEFTDLPYETLLDGLREAHPRIFATADTFATGSLVAEAR